MPIQSPPALAQRDPEAFGLLCDRYADLVVRACWRRLGVRERRGPPRIRRG